MIAPVAGCPDLMVSDMTQVFFSFFFMVTDMTQEIGFVESIKEGASPNYEQHPLGSLLQLVKIHLSLHWTVYNTDCSTHWHYLMIHLQVPYHACATAACHPVYYLHNSDGIVTEEWRPCRGW